VYLKGVFMMQTKDPFDLFRRECPELAERFENLVEVQKSLCGLDLKTKQLINVAIQTATRNPGGVRIHATMAQKAGANKEEIVGAVVMNLHLAGLVTVLECLPAALAGLEEGKTTKRRSTTHPS
jgi:AhpD family alkylhydroperoxidase